MDQPDQNTTSETLGGLRRRQFLVVSAGAVAGGLLSACSSSPNSSASNSPSPAASAKAKRHGGNLNVGLTGGSTSDTVDPHKGLTYMDTARLQSLYSPLIQLNALAQLEYVLAESISPHNGSLTEWEIRLRQGVTFHDGQPLTANDVLYTFNRVLSGHLSGTIGLGPIDIKATKAVDAHTVLVKLTQPFSSFPVSLASFWYYLYIAPTGFNPAHPNGTGPFAYKSFTPGQRSVFTRNPHYWRSGLPYADTLTLIDFPDAVTLSDSLETNVIQAAGTLEPSQFPALVTRSGIKTLASKAGGIVPFTMRVDKPPFNDVKVRQAMRLLVNRPQLIDSALNGYARLASDVSSPYDPDFNPANIRHQDIPQAKFLLKQAGQEHLQVTLTTSDITTGAVALATVLAEQAQAAGVSVKLSNVPPGTFFGPNNYLQWPFSQDYYNYFPYLSQVAQSFLGSASPFNETHTNNKAYTSLYNQANATADPSTRKQLLYEMQHFDFTEGGYIIPAFVDVLDAYSDKITGYRESKVGQPVSNFEFENFAYTS